MSTITDRRQNQFAQVESALLRDPRIPPQCKALYSLLITYGPEHIYPGHERLGQCMGMTRQTVIKWLGELKALGLIDWERRGSTSNEYTILGYENIRAPDDVKKSLQQMLRNLDNRCKEIFTGSISSNLDPDKKECAPDGAFPAKSGKSSEIQSSSPSDMSERPEQPSILEQKDPLSMIVECTRRSGGRASWTVVGPEGANPYEGTPLQAFCALANIPELPPPKKCKQWAAKLAEIAELWQADPELVMRAIRAIAKSEDHKWRSFTSPFNDSFAETLGIMITRVRSGDHTPVVRIRN